MPSPGIEGKVVIVTGAGRGIGRDVALLFAKEGAKVVVNDLGTSVTGEGAEATPAESVVAEIREAGGMAVANADSVAEWDGAERMVAQALSSFGRLDAVVNNAGIIRETPFQETGLDDWDLTLKVHLYGAFHVARAASSLFRDQGSGAYIHMTSSTGLIGRRNLAAYVSAKLGVVGLSRAIALDMGRFGVRSNCIAPAASTRMSPPRATADKDTVYKAQVRGDHVAPLAVFLASDAARSITGQIFGVRRNELYLYSQPRPLRTLHRADGWTLAALQEQLIPAWEKSFTPLEETQDVFAWTAI
ncbi:MAG TPA: SDR family oxidoreductase [Stellaceae bacterium]|nr:SDR family oxidoreductase [Stellaceae bacterium]